MNPTTRHDEAIATDLTAAARERKAAILASLQAELRARRTRRSLVRGSSVAVLLLATATLVWVAKLPLPDGSEGGGVGSALKPPHVVDPAANVASKPLPEGRVGVGSLASTPTTDGRSQNNSTPTSHTPRIHIAHIQTDPTILDRLATKPTRSRIEQISDDELLHAMQEAGRPAGLIRAQGKLTVIEQNPQSSLGG